MRIYIETYGCTANHSDSDILRYFVSRKYTLVNDYRDADIVIINSCGVIDFTERKILKRAKKLKDQGKTVIITGCLPKINPDACLKVSDAILSNKSIHRINEAIEKVINGEKFVDLSSRNIDKSCFKKLRLNSYAIAIINIAEGCLGKCSYCATKFARGHLKSFDPNNIYKEVENAVEEGYKEIQITSQDNAIYGIDIGLRLPDLLKNLLKIKGKFWIRVGMMNPEFLLEIIDDLLDVYKNPKIYKFFHIPIQSGDDEILKHMNRNYDVKDIKLLINKIRRQFPEATIATDIIVGYPTEDEYSFEKTFNLVKELEFDLINITRYSRRKGTPAYKYGDIPDRIKKERSRKLTLLHVEISYRKNMKLLGRIYEVLVTSKGREDTYISRNINYKQIILKDARIGEFYETEIIDFDFQHLYGSF